MMRQRKIGLVVAIEMDAVLAKYGNADEEIHLPGYSVQKYSNDTYELYAVSSGAGEISAAAATQLLITHFHVDTIINFGVVGSLTENIKTAELCLVEKVVHYDYVTTGWLNLAQGQYPGTDSPYVYASAELIEVAKKVNPNILTVTCASADKFVNEESAKRALNAQFNAEICEMEAAAIIMTAKRNQVPVLCVKAVSDSLIGGGKEFFKELNRISVLCIEMVDKIIRSL